MTSESAESLAQMVAARVRELVETAEQRAQEIVREAEAEAQRIRARAEADARERAEQVRRALEALESSLGGAVATEIPPPPKAEVDPSPTTVPEPELPLEPEPQLPEQPEPGPVTVPEPQPTPVPEPEPPPDEADRPSAAAVSESTADVAAARIVAAKMALDGASREEIDRHLAETYVLADRAAILDEVLARVGR